MPAKAFLGPLFVVLIGLVGCQGSENSPDVIAENAFVIEPLVGRDVTLGGVTLIARKGAAVRLVKVTSPHIEAIELHSNGPQGGRMIKAHASGLEFPENGRLVLERGGDHFMMFGISEAHQIGDQIPLMLFFETDDRAFELTVPARVISLSDPHRSDQTHDENH